jgi:hypothetical protein
LSQFGSVFGGVVLVEHATVTQQRRLLRREMKVKQ